MPILNDISVLYQCGPDGSEIRDAAVVWKNERIQWVGSHSLLPIEYHQELTISARGGIAIPGLIDSHTHLGFGGWRPLDYLGRLHGDAYATSHEDLGESCGEVSDRDPHHTSRSEALQPPLAPLEHSH